MLTTGYRKSEGLQAVVRMPLDSDITKRDEKQGYTDVPGSTVQDWVGNLTLKDPPLNQTPTSLCLPRVLELKVCSTMPG